MNIFSTYGSPEHTLAEIKKFLSSNSNINISFFKIFPSVLNNKNLIIIAIIGWQTGTRTYQIEFFFGPLQETLSKLKSFLANINPIFFEFYPFIINNKELLIFASVLY